MSIGCFYLSWSWSWTSHRTILRYCLLNLFFSYSLAFSNLGIFFVGRGKFSCLSVAHVASFQSSDLSYTRTSLTGQFWRLSHIIFILLYILLIINMTFLLQFPTLTDRFFESWAYTFLTVILFAGTNANTSMLYFSELRCWLSLDENILHFYLSLRCENFIIFEEGIDLVWMVGCQHHIFIQKVTMRIIHIANQH